MKSTRYSRVSHREIVRGLWWRILLAVVLVGLWLALAVSAGQGAGEARPVWLGLPGAERLAVVGQGGEYGFVSGRWDAVTLFEAAWDRGSVGLLGHDYLAGGAFYGLEAGEVVSVGFEGGEVRRFVVREVLVFEAVEPGRWWTAVRDEGGNVLSQEAVFELVYGRGGLVLQTCWGGLYEGWLFVVGDDPRLFDVFLPVVMGKYRSEW